MYLYTDYQNCVYPNSISIWLVFVRTLSYISQNSYYEETLNVINNKFSMERTELHSQRRAGDYISINYVYIFTLYSA